MRTAVLLHAATPAFRVDASGVETPVFWLAPSGLSLGVLRMNDATCFGVWRDERNKMTSGLATLD
jgi:hypothetical protein